MVHADFFFLIESFIPTLKLLHYSAQLNATMEDVLKVIVRLSSCNGKCHASNNDSAKPITSHKSTSYISGYNTKQSDKMQLRKRSVHTIVCIIANCLG